MNKDLKVRTPKADSAPQKRASSDKVNNRSHSISSKKGGLSLIPNDEATNNLKNLSKVRFLNQDSPTPASANKLIDAKPAAEKAGFLAQQYLSRQQNVNQSILKVIN